MKRKFTFIFIAVLLAVTAIAAVWHLNTRTEVALGEILVSHGGRDVAIPFDELTLSSVRGEIVNGRGEVTNVDATGIRVSDALMNAGIDIENLTSLTVVASDEYRAELTGDEVRESGKAWLTFQEDGSLRLIVFGDLNSKRNVSDVVRMEVQ